MLMHKKIFGLSERVNEKFKISLRKGKNIVRLSLMEGVAENEESIGVIGSWCVNCFESG